MGHREGGRGPGGLFVLGLVAAAVLPAGPAFADTVSLPAARDNTLYNTPQDRSNGAGIRFFAGVTAKGSIRRALIKFDFSSIPSGSTIDGVTLTLYMSRTTAPVQTITLHRVLADWGEGTTDVPGINEGQGTLAAAGDTTWLYRFYPDIFWTAPGGDFVATESAAAPVGSIGFYSWTSAEMASDVQAWLGDPSFNFGWLIAGNEAAQRTAKRFDSRENTVVAQRPVLVVHYTPPPVGACCGTESGCIVVTEAYCLADRGTYQGDGTTCSPDLCPPPVGACCVNGSACALLPQPECAAQSGTYEGDGTSCSPNPCPQPPPTGACCATSGACAVLTQADCLSQSGTYEGDGTSCSPDPCPPPPTGACCTTGGACAVLTQADCLTPSGTYQGDGTNCNPDPCPPPTGACCGTGSGCTVLTETDCLSQSGVYDGDGTTCNPAPCPPPATGACCAPGGACAVLTEADCLSLSGMYEGDGTACDGGTGQCPACLNDGHCDDGDVCNGVETCSGGACAPGTPLSCGDGLFCNGPETCDAVLGCLSPGSPCGVAATCDEAMDTCDRRLQPRAGEPLDGLTFAELDRFYTGQGRFAGQIDIPQGLGPIFNQDSCGACHSDPLGGSGPITVTRFGRVDNGAFDPLSALGGSLLQAQVIDAGCSETVPPEANVVAERVTSSTLGFGLLEAVPDADILAREQSPPSGISGRTHVVIPFEAPGTPRFGRFGWKAQVATVLTFSADAALNEMGLTNRFVTQDNAPNGDVDLLAQCDTVADPEDHVDGEGYEFIDRVTDFQRFLAAPPQTPRSGMSGEALFVSVGCAACHAPAHTTGPAAEAALSGKLIKPYSDFLLHDMGLLGDGIVQGDAQAREMRTPPLWGMRRREPLLHDGRVAAMTLASRVQAVLGWHDATGSEASAAASAFLALSSADQAKVVAFLDSLGRAEFDHEGDNDVDLTDYDTTHGCLSEPGAAAYTPDDPCAISDFDQDGDVDLRDIAWMQRAFTGEL